MHLVLAVLVSDHLGHSASNILSIRYSVIIMMLPAAADSSLTCTAADICIFTISVCLTLAIYTRITGGHLDIQTLSVNIGNVSERMHCGPTVTFLWGLCPLAPATPSCNGVVL